MSPPIVLCTAFALTDLQIYFANASTFKSEEDNLSPLSSAEGKYLKDNSRTVKSIQNDSMRDS